MSVEGQISNVLVINRQLSNFDANSLLFANFNTNAVKIKENIENKQKSFYPVLQIL